jgi:mono/diheme cytochrome c family protein
MGVNRACRRVRTSIPAIAISCGAIAVSGTTVADYRTFIFSAAAPYYQEGGKVDFGTYNGFRRYHSECHVCHGPAGLGSSYAPALMTSLQRLSFHEFVDITVRGRVGRDNLVMPGFAGNMNVLPYLHDIYAYLKARSDGVIGAARPQRFPKVAMAGMPGMGMGGMPMGGMSGMGMGGMSGMPMGGMPGMGMGGMPGKAGMSGGYVKGPDGAVYLFPAGMGGMMSGGGMGGMSGMGMGGQNR